MVSLVGKPVAIKVQIVEDYGRQKELDLARLHPQTTAPQAQQQPPRHMTNSTWARQSLAQASLYQQKSKAINRKIAWLVGGGSGYPGLTFNQPITQHQQCAF